nr:hypothetical protein [Tanacetum cinerariifolium]
MSHESSPMVPSLDADEGSMQQRLHELMELCTSLQRQQSQMADKIKDQDIEISGLKARVKSLENKESRRDGKCAKFNGSCKYFVKWRCSFLTASVSPADVFPTAGVPTKVTETKVPKKKKLQEQIDAQVAREMEEEFARENQRLSEQVARDYEIARIHAEEELKLMIKGLDRSNEVIAKHLSEYEQAEADLSVGEKIELISELVKYQDYLAEILKYQAQQSKPSSKKKQMKFYMSVLKSHAGWKTEHFRGMTLEQIKEKFIPD